MEKDDDEEYTEEEEYENDFEEGELFGDEYGVILEKENPIVIGGFNNKKNIKKNKNMRKK